MCSSCSPFRSLRLSFTPTRARRGVPRGWSRYSSANVPGIFGRNAVASRTLARPRCHNGLLRRELTRDRAVSDAVAVEGTEPDLAIYRDGRRGTGVRRGRGETREVADDERLRVDALGRKAAGTRRAGDT